MMLYSEWVGGKTLIILTSTLDICRIVTSLYTQDYESISYLCLSHIEPKCTFTEINYPRCSYTVAVEYHYSTDRNINLVIFLHHLFYFLKQKMKPSTLHLHEVIHPQLWSHTLVLCYISTSFHSNYA